MNGVSVFDANSKGGACREGTGVKGDLTGVAVGISIFLGVVPLSEINSYARDDEWILSSFRERVLSGLIFVNLGFH
jgi:hypothetical protein